MQPRAATLVAGAEGVGAWLRPESRLQAEALPSFSEAARGTTRRFPRAATSVAGAECVCVRINPCHRSPNRGLGREFGMGSWEMIGTRELRGRNVDVSCEARSAWQIRPGLLYLRHVSNFVDDNSKALEKDRGFPPSAPNGLAPLGRELRERKPYPRTPPPTRLSRGSASQC